jgi:4-amino-4-deoxy-L-arabinose transferase-like glycosyltransferase
LLLTAVVFSAAVVNWHWLQQNVVTYGWDRMDHLITSLVYYDMSRHFTADLPFRLLAYSSYYPPLTHYGIVLLYQLFGVSEDVAAMVNIPLLAILGGSTWVLARRLVGRWSAALAVVLLALFPMIFAMSRYLYIDFALTAMVALALACLLAGERFRRRRASLLFGGALALTLLVKWTAPAFIGAPLLYIVLRSGVLVTLFRQPARLRPNGRRLLLAAGAAGGLTALLLLPASAAVATTPLGWWLFPALALLSTGGLYALAGVRPAADPAHNAAANMLSAAALTLWLAGHWFLINLEFIDYWLFTAYGRDEPFLAFGKYLHELFFEQIGPALALLMLGIALGGLWQQRRRAPTLLRTLSDTGWVLLLWVVVAFFLFSFRVTLAHTRYIMPLLPPLAIGTAVALAQWRPRWLQRALAAALLAVALAQYVLISFDELKPLRDAVAGPPPAASWLARGFSIQFPTSERTDPGYAIAPAVLAQVDSAPRRAGDDFIHLGLLVNSYQLHEKHFLYQIHQYYPKVMLRELARNWSERPAYNQLFEMDFVLVSDTHDFRTAEASQVTAQRILFDPADAFNQAFAPVARWTLPSGEVETLYGRRFPPVAPGVDAADFLQLLTLFGDRLGAGDAVILTSPDLIYALGQALPADAGAAIVPLPAAPDDPDVAARLAETAATHNRLFWVAHNEAVADPRGAIRTWLDENLLAGNAEWAGSLAVTPFVARPPAPRPLSAAAAWPNGLALATATVDTTLAFPGGVLTVDLQWAGALPAGQRLSLQLLAPDGSLAAQADRDLAANAERLVLLPRRSTAPGPHRLALVLYDPATGEWAATSWSSWAPWRWRRRPLSHRPYSLLCAIQKILSRMKGD